MPGRSRLSALPNVVCTCRFRVDGSITESIAVTRPGVFSSLFSIEARTGVPTLSAATCCCGTEKFT